MGEPEVMDAHEAINATTTLISPPTDFKGARIFDPIWKNGDCTLVLNQALNVTERIKIAFELPPLLHEPRLLTRDELRGVGYTELEPDKIYWLQTPTMQVPGAIRMSAQWLSKHGFIERMRPIRERMLSEDFKTVIYEKRKRTGKSGGRFLLGFTQAPHSGLKTVNISPQNLGEGGAYPKDVVVELTKIVSEATQLALPMSSQHGREDRWHQNASLTVGSMDNHIYTNLQLNFTKEDQALTQGLKKFGGVHSDKQNDPSILTAVISWSHHSPDYFPGRFNVTSLHLTTPLHPYEITLFPGRFFHCSTGSGTYTVPPSSPLRYQPSDPTLIPPLPEGTKYTRLITPLWASERLMNPEIKWLREYMYTPTLENVFENPKHRYMWMMRFFISNEPEILWRLGNKISPLAGSGPRTLILATQACKVGEDKAEILSLASKFPRRGKPGYYCRLFRYQTEDGKDAAPDKRHAKDVLDALGMGTAEFDKLMRVVKTLGTAIGVNSAKIPFECKGERAKGKLRMKERARVESEMSVRRGSRAVVEIPRRSREEIMGVHVVKQATPAEVQADEQISLIRQTKEPTAGPLKRIASTTELPKSAVVKKVRRGPMRLRGGNGVSIKPDPRIISENAAKRTSELEAGTVPGNVGEQTFECVTTSNGNIASDDFVADSIVETTSFRATHSAASPELGEEDDSITIVTDQKSNTKPTTPTTKPADLSSTIRSRSISPLPPFSSCTKPTMPSTIPFPSPFPSPSPSPFTSPPSTAPSSALPSPILSHPSLPSTPPTTTIHFPNLPPPTPDTEYEISHIISKQHTSSSEPPLYLIRWKGWGPEWDEWKTEKELEGARELVGDFERGGGMGVRCGDREGEGRGEGEGAGGEEGDMGGGEIGGGGGRREIVMMMGGKKVGVAVAI